MQSHVAFEGPKAVNAQNEWQHGLKMTKEESSLFMLFATSNHGLCVFSGPLLYKRLFAFGLFTFEANNCPTLVKAPSHFFV